MTAGTGRYWLHGIEAACVVVPAGTAAHLVRARGHLGSRALRAWLNVNGGGHVDCWAVLERVGPDSLQMVSKHPGNGEEPRRANVSLLPPYRGEAGSVRVAMWGDARIVPGDASRSRLLTSDPAVLAAAYVCARLAAIGMASPEAPYVPGAPR